MTSLHADVQPLTVRGLVATLGSPVLRATPGAVGLDQVVSVPVIYDRLDEVVDTPGGVLLMAGLTPDAPEAIRALRLAAKHGFCAAIIKLRNLPVSQLEDAGNQCGIAVLAVSDDAPWRHVGNLIAAVMSSRSATGSAADAAGSDLFVLANAVATATGGAAAIEDLDRNVLAYSNLEHHAVDVLRQNGILARQVPDLQKHNDQYRQVMTAGGVVHFPYDPSDGELPRCAAPVRAGKEALGSIWVIESSGSIGPEAEAALLEAARLAAVHILRARSSVNFESQVRSEWLRSLFDGLGSVPVTGARFGLAPEIPSAVLGFTLALDGTVPGLPQVRQLAAAVEQYCVVFEANVSCVSIGPNAYVLCPAVRASDTPLRLARGAAAAAETRLGQRVLAAVSSQSDQADRLPGLRREVDEILNVLLSSRDTPSVASAEEVHAHILLAHLAREFKSSPRLRHPGVAEMIAHDTARGTDYARSLCAYLSALGDVRRAADDLGVHANTLRYRLKRAQTLFQLRLNSPDDQLTIWLQLRLEGGAA